MEYEIITKNGTFFAYGVTELKATIKGIESEIITIWKNIKYNGTCEDVTKKYIRENY